MGNADGMVMTDERDQEIDVAEMLCDLAFEMEYVAICMEEMLEHTDLHAAELRGAASMVRQWSDRLR